jgi:uncharacterized membrane protein YccC
MSWIHATLQHFMKQDTVGIHYAVRILVAASALWFLLGVLAERNPIWAISSMVSVTEPELQVARSNFRARIANTAIGGSMGLLFLIVAGPQGWVLPLAMAATVLVSSYVVHVQTYWRIAPITAALVMASSLADHTRVSGEEAGLRRLGEVFLGSAMALAVAYVFSKIWPPPPPKKAPAAHQGR